MRLALILYIFFCVCVYAQDEHNSFSLNAVEPKNFFINPYKRSKPQSYEAPVRYSAKTPVEWREADNEFFKRRSYLGKAEVLSIDKPETPAAQYELTASEKRAMLEHLLYTRYYEGEDDPLYDAMKLLPEYYCSTADYKLMSIFLDMLWTNQQLADNHDWLALAQCFICRPENMLNTLRSYSRESKRLYSAQIQRGMELLLSNQQKYQELKQVLDMAD